MMLMDLFVHLSCLGARQLAPPVPIAQVVEHPLREREVAGSKPGRAIPKALKMVPVASIIRQALASLTQD